MKSNRIEAMGLDKFIAYVVLHSELLIEVSIALVAVTSLYLAARAFLRDDHQQEGSSAGASTDLGQIEATLKKIVEQGGISRTGSVDYAAAGLTPEQVAQATELQHEVEKLKAELGHRTTQLEELKAKEASGTGGDSNAEDLSKLEARIKELESKLSEYEIISEDIADLSFYKEENQKLQKELEALKNSGTPAAVVAPVAAAPEPEIVGKSKVAEAAPAPEAAAEVKAEVETTSFVDDDIMAEFAKAVEQQVATKPQPKEEPAPPQAVDDDLMAEFAKAVEQQVSGKSQEDPAAPPVEVAAEIDPVPESEPVPEPVMEVVSAPEEASAVEEVASGLGEMNLDKIVEEAQVIEASPVAETDSNILEESLNEDKLLAEADQFNVNPEDAQAIGQFEEFVKKS